MVHGKCFTIGIISHNLAIPQRRISVVDCFLVTKRLRMFSYFRLVGQKVEKTEKSQFPVHAS